MKTAALLLFMTTAARAQEERLALTWSAPPGCPSESEVTSAVLTSAVLRNAAARTAETQSGLALIARAQVSQRGAGSTPTIWHVLLHTQRGGAHGQREIEAESCSALAQATAVVLSLALLDLEAEPPVESGSEARPIADFSDEEAPNEADPSPSESKSRAETRPAAILKEPGADEKKRVSSDEQIPADKPIEADEQDPPLPQFPPTANSAQSLARFSVGGQVGLTVGTLPRPAPGGALSLAWLPGRFRLEFDAKMWGRQSQSIDDTPSGADLFLSSLGARTCVAARRTPRLDLSPCLGSEFHVLSARGFGSDSNYQTRANWPALTGGLLGLVRLTERFLLRAHVEGQVPLARPRFFVERLGTVHRIPPGAVTTLLGVEVHFP